MNIHTLNPIPHYRLKSVYLRCDLANYVPHFSPKKIFPPMKHRPSYGLDRCKRRGSLSTNGNVPASTGAGRRCIGDILKRCTDLNFSHLDWDVGDATGTSATSPEKRPHIIVRVPAASPFHWLGRVPVTYDDMEIGPSWKHWQRRLHGKELTTLPHEAVGSGYVSVPAGTSQLI